MKIKVGRRYLTVNKRVIFINYEDHAYFYGVFLGTHGQACFIKDGTRVDAVDNSTDLVAPYKPKRREPKVGDRIEFELNTNSTNMRGQVTEIRDPKEIHVVNYGGEFVITRRQIVRFLNKEKLK